MPRIINIIEDPHICSSLEPILGENERVHFLFKYRCFVEDDNGEIMEFHLTDNDIKDNIDFSMIVREEEEGMMEEIDKYNLDVVDLVKFARADALAGCGDEEKIKYDINELVEDLCVAGFDMKDILKKCLLQLYREMFQKK